MAAETSLPHRGTGMSDDAVPDTDPSDVRFPQHGPIRITPFFRPLIGI